MSKSTVEQISNALRSPWVEYTEYFILSIILIIIVVDLFLAFNNQPGDTISEVLIREAYNKLSVLVWAWGVLAGHLFLGRSEALLGGLSIPILLALTLVFLLIGLFVRENIYYQSILLIFGALAGFLLWPQEIPTLPL